MRKIGRMPLGVFQSEVGVDYLKRPSLPNTPGFPSRIFPDRTGKEHEPEKTFLRYIKDSYPLLD